MAIDPKVFKQVRRALGMSQQDLANALGVSRVTINKMERGRLRRGIPDEIAERLMALKPASSAFEMVTRPRHPMNPYGVEAPKADDQDLWDNEEDES
jgi:DNA-binding XRE family transcriptional regulator